MRTVRRADSRIQVVILAGTICAEEVIELTKHAHEIVAAGAGLTPPHYFKLYNAFIYEYYRSVAQSIPVVLSL